MSSYLVIELDTTSPKIDVYAPRFTTREMVTTIIIESNENLGDYQDIYIVDNIGERVNLTFKREDSHTFIGNVRLNNVSVGIVNLYVRLKDEVDNLSDLVSVPIEIKPSLELATVEVSDINKNIINTYSKNKGVVNIGEKSYDTKVYDKGRLND